MLLPTTLQAAQPSPHAHWATGDTDHTGRQQHPLTMNSSPFLPPPRGVGVAVTIQSGL